jgi:DnaK suppressor protein
MCLKSVVVTNYPEQRYDPERWHQQKWSGEAPGLRRAATMSRSEINKFRTLLAAKQTELAPRLRKRDGIAIERTPDALDEVRLATERELVTRNLERESKVLRDVRAALTRIEQGIYGTCLNCEEEIGLKRLNAVPWTPLCIACQEQDDRGRNQSIDQAGWSPARAA